MVVAAVEVELEVVGPAAAAEDTVEDPDDESAVDALFARIREARSDAVARAYEAFGPADAPEAAVVVADSGLDEEPTREPDLFAQRDAVIDPFEAKLARLFKRSVTDEQNEMQDAIRRRKNKATVDEILADPDTHAARYEAAVTTTMGEVARAGAAMFELTGTVDDESFRPMTRRIVGASLVAPLRAQLDRVFADTTSDDDSVAALFVDISAQRRADVRRTDAGAGRIDGRLCVDGRRLQHVRLVRADRRGCLRACRLQRWCHRRGPRRDIGPLGHRRRSRVQP